MPGQWRGGMHNSESGGAGESDVEGKADDEGERIGDAQCKCECVCGSR